MKGKLYILILFIVALHTATMAQQVPITSQYLTNGLIINPAYAGTRGSAERQPLIP